MTPVSENELRDLSAELELFGVPLLPLKKTGVSNIVPALVEALWTMMSKLRGSIQKNAEHQEEQLSTSMKELNLKSEVSSLSAQLATSESRLSAATSRASAANSRIDALEADLAASKREAALLHNRLQRVHDNYKAAMRKKDEEILELKEKGDTCLRPKSLVSENSWVERERVLKKVICKYFEANERLTERNIELTHMVRRQMKEACLGANQS